MNIHRLLLITFVESFATILLERGVYFYTHERLGFSAVENLWLALAFGAGYAAAALVSHPLSQRMGEKRLAAWMIGGQAAAHMVLAARPTTAVVVVANTLVAAFNGLKWPLIESFVGAGQGAAAQARTIGRFNFAWSVAVAPALAVVGPLMNFWTPSLFLLAAALNLASLALLWPLPARPAHWPDDHPQRPVAAQLRRYAALLRASRWLMLASYASLFVIAAVVPKILDLLAVPVKAATALSGLVDATRWLAFVLLQFYVGWHNRLSPLALAAVCLPAGFLMVLLGPSLGVVLAGEALFGLAAGLVYYSALYYAMVVKNASVDAGGVHEGLIGLGFALGPLAALLGTPATPWLCGRFEWVAAAAFPNRYSVAGGVTVLFAVCLIAAALAVRRIPTRAATERVERSSEESSRMV